MTCLTGPLAALFPTDLVKLVPNGVHGGDALQHVHDGNGSACGTISANPRKESRST